MILHTRYLSFMKTWKGAGQDEERSYSKVSNVLSYERYDNDNRNHRVVSHTL